MNKTIKTINVFLICWGVAAGGYVVSDFETGGGASVALAQVIEKPGDAPSAVLDEKSAVKAAVDGIKSLIRQGLPVDGSLLEPQWAQVPDEDTKVSRKGKGFYIVSILNKQDEGRELFVLISDRGEIFDANFSGEFEGLVE